MSDTDSFIEEVTEEVRREALFKYVRKYAWIAVVAVVGIVGVTVYLEWQKSRTEQTAQALGDQVLAALDANDATARVEALAAVKDAPEPAQVIVDMRRAGALISAGDTDGAIAILEGISQTQSGVYADVASFKLLLLKGSDMAADERSALLQELAAPGSMLRPLALEQQAISAVRVGDRATALDILSELVEDSETPNSLQSRATQLLIALGGELPESTQLLSSE